MFTKNRIRLPGETDAPNGLLMKETGLNNGLTDEVTNTELTKFRELAGEEPV